MKSSLSVCDVCREFHSLCVHLVSPFVSRSLLFTRNQSSAMHDFLSLKSNWKDEVLNWLIDDSLTKGLINCRSLPKSSSEPEYSVEQGVDYLKNCLKWAISWLQGEKWIDTLKPSSSSSALVSVSSSTGIFHCVWMWVCGQGEGSPLGNPSRESIRRPKL